MLPITAQLHGVEQAVDAFARALDQEMDAALAAISDGVARDAQLGHTFQNRTGDLQQSIRALDTTGEYLAGTLVGGVIADEDYAEHVDARLPFLQPAFDRYEARAEAHLADALERAARAAGW